MKSAPWTDDEVESLNAYQHAGIFHQFTSTNGHDLIATNNGWVENIGGPIVQDWCHPFMADWSWAPKCKQCNNLIKKINTLGIIVTKICIKCVKKIAVDRFMHLDGIVGVGIGDEVIRIYLRDDEVGNQIPNSIEGFPITKVVTGEITAQ